MTGKTRTLVLVGLAATAVAAIRASPLARTGRASPGPGHDDPASDREMELERSITIGKTPDELVRCWRDPGTLPLVMKGFATVRSLGEGRLHWQVTAPLGRSFEWTTASVDDGQGQGSAWRSLPGAAIPNEGSVRFDPAPAGRGSVATLRFDFRPPLGPLGSAATRLLAGMPLNTAVDGVLRRFKSLVEAGEVPTTERQPAHRNDTR